MLRSSSTFSEIPACPPLPSSLPLNKLSTRPPRLSHCSGNIFLRRVWHNTLLKYQQKCALFPRLNSSSRERLRTESLKLFMSFIFRPEIGRTGGNSFQNNYRERGDDPRIEYSDSPALYLIRVNRPLSVEHYLVKCHQYQDNLIFPQSPLARQ